MPERKVYRFRVDPTAEQEAALSRFAGARRFVFNWALQQRKETYEQHGKPISWSELSVELTELKNKPGFEWLKEIDSQLLQQALADCKKAFDNFFQNRAGFPKFKRKHGAHQSFRIPQRVKLEGGRIYIPKIGWVAARQSQAVDVPLKSATFKREATGKWHVSLVVEFDLPELPKPAIEADTAIGIDVGFDRFATDSDGGVIENPRFFRKAERKIKRASRRLSRCQKGSANRAKARRALAREYEKVANKRTDFAHKFSTLVVEANDTITCETLNLKGMSRTKLAKSVHDAAHSETLRQIEYKTRWRNRNFVLIDRWFPSSQLCSCCGHRNQELSLSDRFWNCANCGAQHDRDHNAAKNIRDEGIRVLLAVGHTERLNACGAVVRPGTPGKPR
ncbi:MAG: RNA-guided endonuclease InsQ/TnpB family protein [Blastocatellia bacterium]